MCLVNCQANERTPSINVQYEPLLLTLMRPALLTSGAQGVPGMTFPEQGETRTCHTTVPLSLVLCEKIIAIVHAHDGGGVWQRRRKPMGSVCIWSNQIKLNVENTVVSTVSKPACQAARECGRGRDKPFCLEMTLELSIKIKRACKSDGGKWGDSPRRNTLDTGCRARKVLVPLEDARRAPWDEQAGKEERFPLLCPQVRK